MANVTVSTNPSTKNNTLTVNFTTDVNNITGVQLTKDGSNYISATSFTNTSATFNVASWTNGTYNNCYLKVIYTETSSGGDAGGGSGGSAPATYRITRNLTNCTSTGSDTIDTSIITTFQSIVAPNDGYTLTTLTVSMGGVDYTNRPNVVTDIEWEGKPAKQITIENVNGNIVITANATQTSTSDTLEITSINVLSSTEASTQINYTTNKAVTKHYFNMWYSGADSGFTDGTAKVTDNGNNNYTMTFANELGAGTKSPAIKVEDADGNTYIKTFNLTVTA